MSFSEHEDCLQWQCDTCGLSIQFPPDNFWGAHGELKSRGWSFIRDDFDGSWSHSCAKCKAKNLKGILDRVPGQRLREVN